MLADIGGSALDVCVLDDDVETLVGFDGEDEVEDDSDDTSNEIWGREGGEETGVRWRRGRER